MNLTETKMPDGQPSSPAPETGDGGFAALLEPLSPEQAATGSEADGAGETPAQPTADAEFAAQDLEQLPGEPTQAIPIPQLPLEAALQAEPDQADAAPAVPADENLADMALDAGGKSLPPAGNSLQPATAAPAGVAADPLASASAQAASGTVPGPAPDPTVQKTLRVDGRTPARELPLDTPAAATRSQRPATTGLEPRAPLPAADTAQLADDNLPSQGQEFSARLAGASQAAALNTSATASPTTAQASLAAAFADADAGTTFTNTATSEAAGRVLQDSPAAERALRLPIQQFAGQPGWGEEVRSNLQWLSRQGLHRAELQLHPAELGSIDVRITTENDQASVVFYAANRTARELLEAELPRLRELFSQVGVELTQADVAERGRDGGDLGAGQQGYDEGHNSSIKESAAGADNRNEAVGSLAVDASGAQNLIDYYI
ncbi:MAG: flagellar hook-length control protein FliK [Halieaceae bacterium]|nr:flagellar hook-length control protein FliK [Halieaceae bacterium]